MLNAPMKYVLLATLTFCLAAVGAGRSVSAQGGGSGEHARRAGGRITAIAANTITAERRDGTAVTIQVNDQTRYSRNGEPAELSDFVVGDFVTARGAVDASGQFVAASVRGGERHPRPHGSDHHAGGQVASVDASLGTITVTTRDGATDVIYTTVDTRILRNRQPASLPDIQIGDAVRAHGERDDDGTFMADRVLSRERRQAE